VNIELNIHWKETVVTETGILFRDFLQVSEENHIQFKQDIRSTGPGAPEFEGC
jgi:hypothetical protein